MPIYNIPTKTWTLDPPIQPDPYLAEDSDEENVSYDYDYPSSDESSDEESDDDQESLTLAQNIQLFLDQSDLSPDQAPGHSPVPVTDREATQKLLREKNALVIKSLSKP
jgi:hypothetical protein